jgi:hypothetical protein
MKTQWNYLVAVWCGAALAPLVFAAPAPVESKLIKAKDPAGDEVRAAVAQFLADLADGNEKKVREEFAGDGEGRKLLDKFLKTISASQQLQKAMKTKFGDVPAAAKEGVIETGIRTYIHAIPVETIMVDGDTASMSPGGPIIDGVDLKRVGGVWKVSYPTALHHEDERSLNRVLDAAAAAEVSVAARVEKGEFKSAAEAEAALRTQFTQTSGTDEDGWPLRDHEAASSRPSQPRDR